MGEPVADHPRSFYVRMLRLNAVDPKPWQRAIFVEGSLAVAGLLVMADLASAWVLVALPVAVAGAVKFHDVIAGSLQRSPRRSTNNEKAP